MKSVIGMRQYKVRIWLLAVCFVWITINSGCRSTQSMGDRMSDFGAASTQLGDDWKRGEAMVKKGEKLQRQSASYAERSDSKQSEASHLIEEGHRLMSSSETDYGEQFKTK